MKPADFVKNKIANGYEFSIFPHQFKRVDIFQMMEDYAIYYHEQQVPVYAMKVYPKMREAERYVDNVIRKTGRPPTYREVQVELNLNSVNSAYFRLRRYRDKMKQIKAK